MIEFKEGKASQFIGICLFIFAILLCLVIIPQEVRDIGQFGLSTQFLPYMIAFFIGALSVWLFYDGYITNKTEDQNLYRFDLKEIKLVVVSLLAMVAYILVIEYIGYVFTTIIFLASLMYYFGQRKKVYIALFAILLPIAIEQFFWHLLKMQLP